MRTGGSGSESTEKREAEVIRERSVSNKEDVERMKKDYLKGADAIREDSYGKRGLPGLNDKKNREMSRICG
jgi:hypothetical protein